ncbi:similar to RIKEN cDNA 1600029D21 [Rattus norvegicus]|uniref:Placenta-expressed transcript 1 protein n=1 Tax=Rattus norvegicus TaxID=10116 RepID=A6J4D2_RAT|nr:placenta-expressed transcript 1 protein isoform 2 precursor [Rattus norvegicus]EDL95455.1 similar to RIKEN cDNA 1600029D21 [Rattus norvegicus]|eukprot:XP_017451219.1 PREDICTED: placenta-expressed transcript 1 protein isoform X1 [Rattus norvegicus]
MPALRTLLPHLGLFLCLALCFSPSFSLSNNESCILYDQVYPSDNLINASAEEVSGENTTYTVTVPVNDSVSAVILKAEKDNKPVGTWSGAYEKCNNSVVYNLTSLNNSAFQTNWTVPSSEDVTKVNLTIFIVINRTATVSSVKLEPKTSSLASTPESQTSAMTTAMTSAMTTAKTTAVATNSSTDVTSDNSTAVTTANSTAVTTANSTAVTTAKTTTMTTATTTAKSLAIRTLCSPLAGALHILLVFLISKLLF